MNERISRFEKLLEQFPDNEMARFSLGKALFDEGEFVRAREQLALALAKKSDWMLVQILIGKCDLSLGRRAEAKSAFERARQLAIEQNHEGPLAEMEELLRELS